MSDAPLQAYLDNRLQLFDVLEQILDQTGSAAVYVSTFSTSEEFLRRMFYLKKKKKVSHATLLADLKAAKKTVNLSQFMSTVFDDVYLGENHSKILLICNENWRVSVVTSQNQTRGNRTECGMISTDAAIFETLLTQYSEIINHKSIHLDGLFNPATDADT